jgi:hypothetical protein
MGDQSGRVLTAQERRRRKQELRYPTKCPGCLEKTTRSLLRDGTERCDYCAHLIAPAREQ